MLSKKLIQIQFFGEKENVFHILVLLMMFCKLSLSYHSLLQCAGNEQGTSFIMIVPHTSCLARSQLVSSLTKIYGLCRCNSMLVQYNNNNFYSCSYNTIQNFTVTFTIYKDEMNKGCMLSGELFRASQGGLVGDPRWQWVTIK